MSDNVIRISYVRATFAAGLLSGCGSSLLKITDMLDGELVAHVARRRSSGNSAPIEATETTKLIAAALHADWIADALQRQIAFSVELDRRIAGMFDGPELPPTDAAPPTPPEWPQPPLPEPLGPIPNPLADIADPVELPQPRERIAALIEEILADLDDALKAINWARNVRFQAEIADAATNLRAWVAASADTIAKDL